MNPVHYSSDSDEWETPQWLYDELNKEFKFELDPCATSENAKCPLHLTKEDDGLSKSWGGKRCFVNPPYSKLKAWVHKAWEEFNKGSLVVLLLPARTDTEAFHNYIWDRENHRPQANRQVRFLKGRLRFSGATNSAPFPSMIVVFTP